MLWIQIHWIWIRFWVFFSVADPDLIPNLDQDSGLCYAVNFEDNWPKTSQEKISFQNYNIRTLKYFFFRYQQFKDFQKRILVATNLFGRGMDIERWTLLAFYSFFSNCCCAKVYIHMSNICRVNIVFNYDMPEDTDTYLHRVARAGRFGTKVSGQLFSSVFFV